MTTRKYSSRSQQTTLTGAITSGATSMTVVSGTGLLGGVTIPSGQTFTLVIDVDTALEEIVDATAVSTNTFTITRGVDGSTAQEHSAGAVVRHMAIGRDYRDANLHAEADAAYNDGGGNSHTMHGIGTGEGVVVGTLKTQTLTNKTLTSPTISNPTFTGTPNAEASIIFEGATADAHETTLTVVDPTQDNTITLPNTTGTVVLDSATQTLTNKTLTSPTISGSPVITGLSSAGMVASSATPKDYVDAILGSATAAATSAASAATSAASAATSASSASTSASSALTSANSASTSATAAATSATSAAASATAAATSATSAAASATAAATSATSAETSATASASSASAAATSATSAAASATAAATSATSAAASATAAATSASSAATSASSAATSYDQFDDRYLGDKSSDPTVDNDGNPLLTGALYYNTAISAMKVYSGSAWQLVAPDTSNFVDKAAWTGKGAIVSATAASTPSALTVASTNGYILTVNSATATGLEWTAPSTADITGVTAGTGLSGGGTSGDVTLSVNTSTVPLLNSANTFTAAPQQVTINSAANVGLVLKGAASQSGDFLQILNSGNTKLSYIDSNGSVYASSSGTFLSGSNGRLQVTMSSPSVTAVTVRGAASQSADLQQWLKSDATVLAKVDSAGNITANSITAAPIVSINTQTGTTYTPVLSDANALVTLNNSSAITVSIPTNASVAYPIGSQINFAWITGAGQPTITAAATATTTILSTGAATASPKLRVVNATATAIKIATDSWLVVGDIS